MLFFHIIIFMVPLDKFDISLKNTPPPPGLVPCCTESWQRFPPIFFSISLAPTNTVVRVHTKNDGKTQKTKGIYRKTRKPLRRREVLTQPYLTANNSNLLFLIFSCLITIADRLALSNSSAFGL